MQKFILKNKDKAWFLFFLAVIYWIVNKLLDLALQTYKNDFLYPVFNSLRSVFAFEISLSVLSLLIGIILTYIFYRTVRLFQMRKRKLIILDATYGLGSKQVNITDELNEAIDTENNKLKIVLSNNIAGDPCHRRHKEGKIRYIYDSVEYEHEYKENDIIELPDVGNSKKINEEILWWDKPGVKIISLILIILIGIVISLAWGVWAYTKVSNESLVITKNFLSLNQPKIIPQIEVRKISEMNVLEITVENTGNVKATNPQIKIYTILFDGEKNYLEEDIQPKFSEKLFDLQPGVIQRFGNIFYRNCKNLLICSNGEQRCLDSVKGESMALIYDINYYDEIFDKSINEQYWFKYTIGDSEVYSLSKTEASKIGQLRLEQLFKNDESLLKSLDNIFK